MNNTAEEVFQAEPMNTKIIKAVAAGLVTLISIFGNILVIMAVWLIPRMRTITNYFIVNMAVSDLLYVLIAMPPFYIEIFELHEWVSSSYMNALYVCKILHFAQYFLIGASVLTLACLAFDRFVAIVFPLRKLFTNKVFYVTVASIWVIAAGLGAPALYAWKPIYYEGYGYGCGEEWAVDWKESEKISIVYSSLIFAVAYCIPFLSITIMYSIVCRRVWKRKVIKSRHRKQYRKAIESRKKVVKMLITVVIAFVMCWLPLQITTFMWHAGILISATTHFICKFLMRMHTATSPLIYAVFSENYRKGFGLALKCCFGRQSALSRSLSKLSQRMTITTRRSSIFKSGSRDNTPTEEVLHTCNGRKLQTQVLLKESTNGEA